MEENKIYPTDFFEDWGGKGFFGRGVQETWGGSGKGRRGGGGGGGGWGGGGGGGGRRWAISSAC